jgi:alpha-glucosidase
MKKLLLTCFVIPYCLHTVAADIIVKSPDGQVAFQLMTQNKVLMYKISFKNETIINTSPLIFSLDDRIITHGVNNITGKSYSINESYPWWGVHSKAVNHCNGSSITIKQDQVEYAIDVRVFNDGAAFRIIVPGSNSIARIPDEATVFNLPRGTNIWYHDLYMHYEGVHVKKEISQVTNGEWVAPPATVKFSNGVYASITEADLQNYSGFALQADGKNGLVLRLAQHQPTSYPYRLRYSPEDTARLLQPASIKGIITTPWRVVMIAKDLNSLVNDDMLHNLCSPPDKKYFPNGLQTDWLRPGRAVWKYLNGGGDGTPEVMKHFTDGAAALGFEHNIFEGFWSRWTDGQIKDVVNYSKQKGVDVWVWKHSKSLRTDTARVNFFTRCHELGIRGAKIDFFDHEAKEVVDLYIDILKEAARNKIMVDFHGANKPTGLSRTWPNELTREGVKGMESSKLEDRATHETTIPFTRFIAGPAEYTVMLFSDRKKNSTATHQAASAVILSAPMLTYATHPDTILASPAVEIIKDIPSLWDETIVLPGSGIGELAAYARRKGNTWFIAVMNGVGDRNLKINLGFLKNGEWNAREVRDKDDRNMMVQNKIYKANDVIELKLLSGGGYVAELKSPLSSAAAEELSKEVYVILCPYDPMW